MRGSILLVDDEEKILKALSRALRDAGHEVVDTSSAREAQRLLAERSFDVVLVDNVMPQLSGLDLIREYVAQVAEGDRAQVLMMTAHATVDNAIEAMKLGAFDYLQKPFEIDELLVVVRRALEHQRLSGEHRYLRSERDEQFDHYGIIGRSRAIQEIIKRTELVAAAKSTILITGETGTGKELVARAIHNRSAQRDMPLIRVNCAAIPETLLESELFGHARGAFTGAVTDRKGIFEQAHGGTVLLDEIGDTSLALQVRLLRVLEESEVRPVGSTRAVHVDAHVIASTNADLDQSVSAGRFRQDLFYRLNVVVIHLPPLRERRADIALLIESFLQDACRRAGRRVDISAAAVEALTAYEWPGNVRELENTIERLVVLGRTSTIETADLPPALTASHAPVHERLFSDLPSLEELERRYLLHVLGSVSGNRTRAADVLGVDRRTLYRMAERFGIDLKDEAS